jgi:hypothetical protein
MGSRGEGAVTRWIGDPKSGGNAAAQHLWDRYFERLVRLARKRLQNTRRLRTVEDEEDAALSAFASLCRGVDRGQRSFSLQTPRLLRRRRIAGRFRPRSLAVSTLFGFGSYRIFRLSMSDCRARRQ